MTTADLPLTAHLPTMGPITSTAPRSLAGCEVWFARQGRQALSAADIQWPRACRRICQAALPPLGLQALSDDVGLVVTELVTNALQHGSVGHSIRMSLTLHPSTTGAVRVAVTSAPGWKYLHAPAEPEQEHGRGLHVVDELARSWGIAPGAGQATVWCLLDATPAAPERAR